MTPTKCPDCETEYPEGTPEGECDWCPGVLTVPVQEPLKEAA